jgi:hypothetical protein
MPHPFVHLELNTDDVGKAKGFYRNLFGWSFTDMSMGEMTYSSLDTGTPPGGGVQLKPMPEAPTMWLPYIGVDNVTATVARARGLGATIIVEHMPIPGFGALAILRDPAGATFGLWQAEPRAAEGERPKRTGKRAAKKAAKAEKAGKKADARAKKKADKKAVKAEKADAKAKKKAAKAERRGTAPRRGETQAEGVPAGDERKKGKRQR